MEANPVNVTDEEDRGINAYLLKIFGPEKAARLQREYLGDVRNKLALMETCLSGGDLGEIRVIAHKLKGSGGSYGYTYLTECALAIGVAARSNDIDRLKSLFGDLRLWLDRHSPA